MSAPVPDRLVANRYALKVPLGRGGMGVVWRAQDAVLGREVAVKEVVFPPTMPEEERRPARARVMREARAAARLNHPGAVTLYDVVQDRGGTFIVMELVEAPTLADLVRDQGPLPVERVAEIGAQVASALEAAHAAGIVHRDVKPGNVMVGGRGTAKLADFGIASLQGDPQLTSTGLVIGSPAYMAPEQARGEESGPPADFWALGATMFYAVEGEPPFDRGTSIATLAAVVNDPPRAPRRAGPLADLITALLAKDPAARPSGPALRAELARLASRPASPTEELPAHGPGRTVPLPAAPPEAPRSAEAPRPAEASGPAEASAGAVDNAEQATPRSATFPLRGTSQREPGFRPAAAAAGGAVAAGAAAAGAAGAPGAGAAGAAVGSEAAAAAAAGAGAAAGSKDGGSAGTPAGPVAPAFEPAAQETSAPAGTGPAGASAAASTSPSSTVRPAGPPTRTGGDRPLLPPAPVIDRRGGGRLFGVVALLVVLGLAGVMLAVNLRSGGDGNPTAAPSTRPAGAGADGVTSTAGAPTTTAAPATTAAPKTTGAPTTTAAAGLPAGWTQFVNRRGANQVGVPPGFKARTRKSYNATVVEEQSGAKRVFTVRSQNPSAALPQASRDYRAYARRNFPGFREVRYDENQTYAGHDGAVVFEYEAVREGRRAHVSHINFKGRSWGYNVEFVVPAGQWDASQDLARQFEQAFRALG